MADRCVFVQGFLLIEMTNIELIVENKKENTNTNKLKSKRKC